MKEPRGRLRTAVIILAVVALLFVLAGSPALRTPEGWRDLTPGECVCFPTGERGAPVPV